MFKELNYVTIFGSAIIIFVSVIQLNFVYSAENFNNDISDIVDPVEFCHNTIDCKELMILGQVTCSENVCFCANHSRYMHETKDSLRGCYTKVSFGDQCDYTKQCITPKSVCKGSCENNEPKFCDCPVGHEFFQGICKEIEDKYLVRCCANEDCQTIKNTNNLICKEKTNSTKLKQCICDLDYVYNESDCIHYIQLGYCQKDEDCNKNGNNAICSYKNVTSINNQKFGKCLCAVGHLFHEDRCLHYKTLNLCITDQDCDKELKNSYCDNSTEINYYGTCSCKKGCIRHEKECVYYNTLNLCLNDQDCKEKLNNSFCEISTEIGYYGTCSCLNGYIRQEKTCIYDNFYVHVEEENNKLAKIKIVPYFEPNTTNNEDLEEFSNLSNLERFVKSNGATKNSKNVLIIFYIILILNFIKW